MARTAWPTASSCSTHGHVVLHVLVGVVDGEGIARGRLLAAEVVAALVEEELGRVEVGPVPGRAVELGQADLDLLVAGEAAALAGAGAEGAQEERSVLLGDVQEGAPAGGLEVGHRRLVHVADVVELVADPQVRPALRPGAGRGVGRVVRPGREEIAVGLLGPGDEGDEVVEGLVEGGVGVEAEGVGGRLHAPCRRRNR